MSELTCLDARYYLFGAYFSLEKRGDTEIFPNWHQEAQLKNNRSLKNVRPLAYTPVAMNISTKTPQLLVTDKHGLLTHLRQGPQKNKETNTFQSAKCMAPVHSMMVGEAHHLTFPPLSAIAQLSNNHPNHESLCKALEKVVKAVKIAPSAGGSEEGEAKPLNSIDNNIKFTLAEILPSQLAAKIDKEPDGSIKPEDQAYNEWLSTLDQNTPLKGFLVPTIYCCVIAFSSPEYTDATVELLRFDPEKGGNGEYVSVAEPVKADALSASDNPCAVFHLDPAVFKDGMYTIRVQFLARDFDKGFPSFLSKSNIDYFHVDRELNYQYDLREYIKPSMTTAFGKMAMICGDVISLEESVLYQYPQLEGMRQYLSGELESSTDDVNSVADNPMNAIWGISKSVFKDVLLSGPQVYYDEALEKPKTLVHSISSGFWDQLDKKNLPDAMIASGELVIGALATSEAYDQLMAILKPENPAALAKEVGVNALFQRYVFNSEIFVKRVWDPIVERRYGYMTGNLGAMGLSISDSGLFKGSIAGIGSLGFEAVNTYLSLEKTHKSWEKIEKAKKDLETYQKDLETVAKSYLEHVTVWDEKKHSVSADRLQVLIDKVNRKEDSDTAKDSAEFIQDARGVGFRLVFGFNSREKEITQKQPLLTEIFELLKKEKNLHVEIEGHACQVDTPEKNNVVAQERAQNMETALKAAFREKASINQRSFGEDKPIFVPADDSEIVRENEKLAPNRRVEVRFYIPSLNLHFPPSRTGMRSLELHRQKRVNTEYNIDKEQLSAVLSLLEGVLGVASYIPFVAPAARGALLVAEGGKLVCSTMMMLDKVIMDGLLNEVKSHWTDTFFLEHLARIHLSMLKELTDVKVDLTANTYKNQVDLKKALKDDGSEDDVIKRFKLRALALNGLMLLLVKAKGDSERLEEMDIQGYIDFFILDDSWSVHTVRGRNLADVWESRGQHIKRVSINSRYVGSTNNLSTVLPSKVVTGDFNKMFPTQRKLYDTQDNSRHHSIQGLEQFTQNFSISKPYIRQDDIGFCQLMITDQNESEPWQDYMTWRHERFKEGKSIRLSPFHKVKLQILFRPDSDIKQVFGAKIGYERDEGLFNVNGPTSQVLFYPKRYEDFSIPNERLKQYFKDHQVERITGVEYEPMYWFGDLVVSGLKPLTADFYINAHAIANFANAWKIFQSDSEDFNFDSYVEAGSFRNMRYGFYIETESKCDLIFENSERRYDNLILGVHGENSTTLQHYEGLQATERKLREKSLLIREFVTSPNSGKEVAITLLENKPDDFVYAIEYQGKISFVYHKGSGLDLDGFDWALDKPINIYLILFGKSKSVKKKEYESMELNWTRQPVEVTLSMERHYSGVNIADTEKEVGPKYQSDMYYVGDIYHQARHPETYKKRDNPWIINKPLMDKERMKENEDAISEFYETLIPEYQKWIKGKKVGLDEDEKYHMFAMKFQPNYVALHGRNVKGIRPFGKLLFSGSNEMFASKLKIHDLRQLNTLPNLAYQLKGSGVLLPRSTDITKAVFYDAGFSKSMTSEYADKDAASRWAQKGGKDKHKALKHWMEKTPQTIEVPQPKSIIP